MVTILAEATHNSDTIKEVMELNVNGYRLVEPRVVAGVKLPPGTELDHIDEEEDGSCCTFYWRIPQDLVLDVFSVINKEVRFLFVINLRQSDIALCLLAVDSCCHKPANCIFRARVCRQRYSVG